MPSEAPAPRSRLLESYVLILVLTTVAVGLSAIGVLLLVTCEAAPYIGPFGTTEIGCAYLFQSYGETFLLAAGIVGTLAIVPLQRIAEAGGRKYDLEPWFFIIFIDVGLVALYIVTLLVT